MPLLATRQIILTMIDYDGESDKDVESSATLSGVSYELGRTASAGAQGLSRTGSFSCRIFATSSKAGGANAEAAYRNPAEWAQRAPGERAGLWTLRPGDKITADGTAYTILRIQDNRGGRRFPHWQVEAQ